MITWSCSLPTQAASEKYAVQTEGSCLCAVYIYTPRDARATMDGRGGPYDATVYVADRRINTAAADTDRNRFVSGVDPMVCWVQRMMNEWAGRMAAWR
jgi:hypothetical protein